MEPRISSPSHEWNVPSSFAFRSHDQIWPEPLDTPGYVPRHLKRAATGQFPILELIQRLLYRLKPSGMGEVERILALVGLYQALYPAYTYLKDFCMWMCTVQVTISEADPVAKEILAWIGSEVIPKSHSRSAMLATGGMHDSHQAFPLVMMPSPPGAATHKKDDGIFCLSPIGTRLFWIGFRPFFFSRRGVQSLRNNALTSANTIHDNSQFQNAITLTTPGWSLKPLQNFVEMCHDFKLKHLTGTTTVYFAGVSRNDPYGGGWQSVSKAVRKLDTIDMDEDVKSDIVRDAEYYYSDESRAFFADCGIPYRRGYLFHGPPGTGKSSFSAALAGHLRCDIYHISLSNGTISDDALHRLFLGLPRKCIVVIEDIDSAGIGRETTTSRRAAREERMHRYIPNDILEIEAFEELLPRKRPTSTSSTRNLVTLSGLLNAIDGNASQEGRLLIMTSNDPGALDAALTRPGRIDKKVYFGNMTKSAGRSIFKRLIGRSAMAYNSGFTPAQIEQWADEFADKVPSNVFSPAQVQNFLQGCRGDPIKALNDVEAWIAENRSTHMNGAFDSKFDLSLSGSEPDSG
ncbi:hypothetical protein COCVIDRAFT_34200 [Bipolaris victoriae FI3]|uniref:AAA+ ATPase domain-containing protein n=1 Tax=Bipolaris victoriae (strain FI3) TaxID=930091 RepID=W7F5Q4_BIPV3|nr:hypothetical protein COCVIDRAFT_34200 [Bipolaris victoriae FI3]